MARIIGLKDWGNGVLEYREQQIKHFLLERRLVLAMMDFLERKEAQIDPTTGRPMQLNREFLHRWIRIQLFEYGNSYFKKLEERKVYDQEMLVKAHDLVKNYLTERGVKNAELSELFPNHQEKMRA